VRYTHACVCDTCLALYRRSSVPRSPQAQLLPTRHIFRYAPIISIHVCMYVCTTAHVELCPIVKLLFPHLVFAYARALCVQVDFKPTERGIAFSFLFLTFFPNAWRFKRAFSSIVNARRWQKGQKNDEKAIARSGSSGVLNAKCFICLYVCMSICLFICMSIMFHYLFVCVCVCRRAQRPACLFVYMPSR
jgi:hypothetical protein